MGGFGRAEVDGRLDGRRISRECLCQEKKNLKKGKALRIGKRENESLSLFPSYVLINLVFRWYAETTVETFSSPVVGKTLEAHDAVPPCSLFQQLSLSQKIASEFIGASGGFHPSPHRSIRIILSLLATCSQTQFGHDEFIASVFRKFDPGRRGTICSSQQWKWALPKIPKYSGKNPVIYYESELKSLDFPLFPINISPSTDFYCCSSSFANWWYVSYTYFFSMRGRVRS